MESDAFVILARDTLESEGLREKRLATLQLRQLNRTQYQHLAHTRQQAQQTRQAYFQELSTLKQARLEYDTLSDELTAVQRSHKALLFNQTTVEEAKTHLLKELEERMSLKERIKCLKEQRAVLDNVQKERQAAYQKLSHEINAWLNKGQQLLL